MAKIKGPIVINKDNLIELFRGEEEQVEAKVIEPKIVKKVDKEELEPLDVSKVIKSVQKVVKARRKGKISKKQVD